MPKRTKMRYLVPLLALLAALHTGCEKPEEVARNASHYDADASLAYSHIDSPEMTTSGQEQIGSSVEDVIASWEKLLDSNVFADDPDYAVSILSAISASFDNPLTLMRLVDQLHSMWLTLTPPPYRQMAESNEILLSKFLSNMDAISVDPISFKSLLGNTAVYFARSGKTEKMLEIYEFVANFDHEVVSDEMRRGAVHYIALLRRASGDGASAAADFERTIQFYLDAGETPPMTLRVNAIVMPAQAGYTVENAGERFHELWLEALPDRNWDAVYVGEHLGHHLRASGDLHAALQVHMEMLDLYRTNADQISDGWAALGRDFDRQYWNELVRTMDVASHAREYETAYVLAMEIAERYDTPGNDLGRTRAEAYARMLGIPHDPPPYADPPAPQ